LFLFAVHLFFAEMFRQPSLQSRLEAALEQEMAAQRHLNINMQAKAGKHNLAPYTIILASSA